MAKHGYVVMSDSDVDCVILARVDSLGDAMDFCRDNDNGEGYWAPEREIIAMNVETRREWRLVTEAWERVR